MIIDCHGHYTTSPVAHREFRKEQLKSLSDPSRPQPVPPTISDAAIRESIETNQLRLLAERGGDVMLFSPPALAMEHHVPDPNVAVTWARACNDLVARVTGLFPRQFIGVCQLPQTPEGPLDASVAELHRCVEELGFVGCNLNPDPSGGRWTSKPLTDEYWFPLYEAMVELDVPAMVHASACCAASVDPVGAHYLNADTTVFMQLVRGDLFARFPTLRFVIPHGGGAVPYHWGRYRGLAAALDRPVTLEHVMSNVFFDTCVYHQAGIDLLFEVIDIDNILFGSEMIGAVRGVDPDTNHYWDDTKRYLDAADLTAEQRTKVYEANMHRVYPRLQDRLGVARGAAA
jgi:4-oxalmesaconate hydratase